MKKLLSCDNNVLRAMSTFERVYWKDNVKIFD